MEAQLDYLAPFLAQLPPGEKLTRWQAVRLKDECLNDFKQRLIDKANLIQARFEKVQPGPWQGWAPRHPPAENRPRAVGSPSLRLVRDYQAEGEEASAWCVQRTKLSFLILVYWVERWMEGWMAGWLEHYNNSYSF